MFRNYLDDCRCKKVLPAWDQSSRSNLGSLCQVIVLRSIASCLSRRHAPKRRLGTSYCKALLDTRRSTLNERGKLETGCKSNECGECVLYSNHDWQEARHSVIVGATKLVFGFHYVTSPARWQQAKISLPQPRQYRVRDSTALPPPPHGSTRC